MDLFKIFDDIKKNAIMLDFQTDSKEKLPVGTSKFGGRPDVPKDFKWFYYEGTDYDGQTRNRPLSFLAQVNCEEVKQYDTEGLLPKKGMLYFFYELDMMTWGFDPKDKGSARVFYFDGDAAELVRTDFPTDMEADYKLPPIKLDFHNRQDLPNYDEFAELHDYGDWDKYYEERASYGYDEEEGTISKLLGYADDVQGAMLLECEKVTNGIYCGDINEIEAEKLEELKKNCSQWQLLFQLDTVTKGNFELMFGDCGRIYFYIKKEDLKNLKFDDCWLILQCC